MIKANYQQGNLSLECLECLPQSISEGISAPEVVLANDVTGNAYTVTCLSQSSLNQKMLTAYSHGKTKYLEVRTPAILEYNGYSPVQVAPGLYRVRQKSDYVHKEHGDHVAKYALLIGKALDLDTAHMKELEFASIVHDIGFAGLEETLWKPKWFGDEDWAIVKQHPVRSARVVEKLIGKVPFATDRVRQYVLHHHAHYDGSGYPSALAGEDIPLGSRIIFIADAFHAMISWRPFREPLPEHVALDRMFADAEYRYDPKLLDLFASELAGQATDAIASIF